MYEVIKLKTNKNNTILSYCSPVRFELLDGSFDVIERHFNTDRSVKIALVYHCSSHETVS